MLVINFCILSLDSNSGLMPKVLYFLLTGAIIAALALFVVFYETETIDEKEVVVPLVNKVVDAKPIEIKPTREETAETIKLEVVRVRPDGSLVIAGKGLPNSKLCLNLEITYLPVNLSSYKSSSSLSVSVFALNTFNLIISDA